MGKSAAAEAQVGRLVLIHLGGMPPESGGFAGTIALREHGSETLPGFQPEFAGLYVMKHYRGQGIGPGLVRSCMKLARFDPKRGCPKRSGQPVAFVAKLLLDVTDQAHICHLVITCIDYTCINQLYL